MQQSGSDGKPKQAVHVDGMGAVADALAQVLVGALVVGLVLYLRWRLYWHRVLSHFNGPAVALPVVGALPYAFGPMSTIFERALRLLQRYGEDHMRVHFWLGELPVLHIMRPEDVECLLSAARLTQKPEHVYGAVSGFFGRGLITLSGDDWFRHRRVLTPAFHFAVLGRYSGIFTRRAAGFARKIAGLAGDGDDGGSFDFMPHITSFVTETVMETAFGLQDEGSTSELKAREDFIQASEDAFKIIAHRIIKPWLMVDALFRWTSIGAAQRKADKVINTYAQNVIHLKRQEILRRRAQEVVTKDVPNVEDDDDDDVGVRRKLTFLDLVLDQEEDVLSDEEILNEVRTLIAVQQTSASTLSFLAVCLALHPDVQRAAYEEVQQVDAEEGLGPLERLNRLKYVERVVKETLRLFPITALFTRTLSEDIVLPAIRSDKGERPAATLPAGLNVSLFIYQTHRDPRHWPEPERFDPDRFLPERSSGRHPFAYVPFSAGPRNCIGQRYAMLQMKAVVAALVRAVELLPGRGCEALDKLALNMNTFLYIRGGFNVRARRRYPGCVSKTDP